MIQKTLYMVLRQAKTWHIEKTWNTTGPLPIFVWHGLLFHTFEAQNASVYHSPTELPDHLVQAQWIVLPEWSISLHSQWQTQPRCVGSRRASSSEPWLDVFSRSTLGEARPPFLYQFSTALLHNNVYSWPYSSYWFEKLCIILLYSIFCHLLLTNIFRAIKEIKTNKQKKQRVNLFLVTCQWKTMVYCL